MKDDCCALTEGKTTSPRCNDEQYYFHGKDPGWLEAGYCEK